MVGNIVCGYEEMVGEKLEVEIFWLCVWFDGVGLRLYELEVWRVFVVWLK